LMFSRLLKGTKKALGTNVPALPCSMNPAAAIGLCLRPCRPASAAVSQSGWYQEETRPAHLPGYRHRNVAADPVAHSTHPEPWPVSRLVIDLQPPAAGPIPSSIRQAGIRPVFIPKPRLRPRRARARGRGHIRHYHIAGEKLSRPRLPVPIAGPSCHCKL